MLISKSNPNAPALVKTGSSTLAVAAGTVVWGSAGIAGSFPTQTSVSLPSLSAGDDVAVWVDAYGALVANKDYMTPPSGGAVLLGGGHYAPGSNGSNAQAGGNTTPQFNEYSLWDIGYRPACPDPRGMTCVAGGFWADIYLLAADYLSLGGTSLYNVEICTGIAKPCRPYIAGGNGTARMAMNWWAANEVMASVGKRLLSYAEFAVAAFGVTEECSRGSIAGTTGLGTSNVGASNPDQAFTSQWGLIQATGCQWVWSRDLLYSQFTGNYGSGPVNPDIDPAYWHITESRGWVAQDGPRTTRGLLMGGKFNNKCESGSRCFDLADALDDVSLTISARGSAPHYQVRG